MIQQCGAACHHAMRPCRRPRPRPPAKRRRKESERRNLINVPARLCHSSKFLITLRNRRPALPWRSGLADYAATSTAERSLLHGRRLAAIYPSHWGIVGPTELLYGVKEQCHQFHPNLVRAYLDIFGEGMAKDFG